MKIIAELIAGSHLYGLSTPESDIDKYYVFIGSNSENKFKNKQIEDFVCFDLYDYLKYLKKTHAQMMELLFAQECSFAVLSDDFVYLRSNKYKLIDSKLFYKSLCRYMEIQKKLAKGKLAGHFRGFSIKQQMLIATHGFSPKQLCNLFRTTYCGKVFFETDHYPTNLMVENPEFGKFLLDLKTNPANYNKDQLMDLAGLYYNQFVQAFNNRKKDFRFDLFFANEVCQKYDLPLLD